LLRFHQRHHVTVAINVQRAHLKAAALPTCKTWICARGSRSATRKRNVCGSNPLGLRLILIIETISNPASPAPNPARAADFPQSHTRPMPQLLRRDDPIRLRFDIAHGELRIS